MFSIFVLCSCLVAVAQTAVLHENGARVINGQIAQPNQFPWHAIVEGTFLNGNRTLCGGALISNTFVLTAAHCIADVNFQFFNVGLGTNNLSRPFLTIEVVPNVNSNRIVHPQYNAFTNANDIGILRLPIQIPIHPAIVPIRLPTQSQINFLFTDVNAVFTGFGRVSNTGNVSRGLRFAETRVLPMTQCTNVFGANLANTNTLCTFGREFDVQGACANDNGGPLVIHEANNTPTLIAVQSFLVQGGCMAAQPAGYYRTGPYIPWITQTTGIPVRN